MKNVQYFFIIFIFTLLIIPSSKLPQIGLFGSEKSVVLPSFSWKSFKTKDYQEQINSWWNRNFGSRSNFLILKNDIYEILNIGQFHSGSFNNIVQGRSGVLHGKPYIKIKFTHFPFQYIENIASDTVAVFSAIRDRLKYMGKNFIFVMAPSKADACENTLPKILLWRMQHIQTPPSFYPAWEKVLKEQNINYINGLYALQQKGMLHDSFPDTGIHWSMLGAGVVWEQAVKVLRDNGVNIQPVQIKGEKIIDTAWAEERDIANLLNISPRYNRGRKSWKMAEYAIASDTNTHIFVFGDSFSNQFYQNIVQSGFNNTWKIENKTPRKEDFFNFLKKLDIVILVYNYPSLASREIRDKALLILNYLDDIFLDEWNNYEQQNNGQWSKGKSSVFFFCTSDDDYDLLFTLKQYIKSQQVSFTVNGKIIQNLNLEQINLPAEIKISIPRDILQKGVNKIELNLKNAMTPFAATQGEHHDMRQLGIFCSDIRVQRSLR